MQRFLFFCFLSSLAWGIVPFSSLSTSLSQSIATFRLIEPLPIMEPHRASIHQFILQGERVLTQGETFESLDEIDENTLTRYLQSLRALDERREDLETLYRFTLLHTIDTNDLVGFAQLAKVDLPPLHRPMIRQMVLTYYHQHYPKHTLPILDRLDEEVRLEQRSLQWIQDQEIAYEEHLRLLHASEVAKARQKSTVGSAHSVLVSSDTLPNGGYKILVENLNPYTITLSLDFERLVHLKASTTLPLYVEIAPSSKRTLLTLHPTGGVSDFKANYGWVRGSALAHHDDSYLYRIPLARGSVVRVSQGYFGETSHKGLGAYAIDFPLPQGSAIYAAREGTVVAVNVSHTQGGNSPSYRPHANYITIQHTDGTMGNYFHLRYGGTAVHVTQKVARGELIGYSGNTGYSTAPHLHFSVTKVDPNSLRRSMTLPIRLRSAGGIITYPSRGDHYRVE